MMSELLLEQIAKGQSPDTEFRRDASDLDALAAVVCSFLNSHGGSVFCGVDEAGKVLGVAADDAHEPSVHQGLAERLTPPALFTVSLDEVNGRTLLTIEVPAGRDRPYVCDGRVFVRRASKTVPADAEELREMVQLKSVATDRWERRPSMAMEDADLDRREVRAMVREASAAGRFSFTSPDDDTAALAELGLYNAKGYTQGADVLFAGNPALRHPQIRVRLTRYAAGKTGDQYLDDRQLQGPLVKIFTEAFDWIRGAEPVMQHFESGRPAREARTAYPEFALREGLVNAFAHRDYAGFSGGLSVGLHPDRIEIWNSGRLPQGLEPAQLRRNHPSLPTNPDIAQVLYLRGLMERVGRGTQRIIQACADHDLRPPKWEDASTGVTLTIFGPRDVAVELDGLNARQRALLAELGAGQEIRPMEYRERFAPGVSERQARRDLAALEELGLLRPEGAGAATTYVRTDRT